jgi:Ion transport protein
MENWQAVLYETMRSQTLNPYLVAVFYISWVFLGNFILLNLFLAILLDSFLEEEDEEEIQLEQQNEKKRQEQKKIRKKSRNNKLIMSSEAPKRIKAVFGDNNSEGEDLEDLDEEQIV